MLINKPLSIVGPGAPVLAISGNTNSRVFHIGPQGNVDIYGLTITEGRVVGTNGIDGDNSWPRPPGPGGFAQGGGVFNEGILRIFDSMIVSNSVQGGRGGNGISADFGTLERGRWRSGGRSRNLQRGGLLGFLELNRCTLTGNRAVGGDGGSGGDYLFTPAVTAPGWGGYASGAGASANSASLESCTVAANLSTGGQGGRGGQLPAAPFYGRRRSWWPGCGRGPEWRADFDQLLRVGQLGHGRDGRDRQCDRGDWDDDGRGSERAPTQQCAEHHHCRQHRLCDQPGRERCGDEPGLEPHRHH